MTSRKRIALISASSLGVAAILASVFVLRGAGAYAATSGNSSTIVYQANPPEKFASGMSQSNAASYTPSQCQKQYGLACYGPSQIRGAYNIPSSATGAGQTIAIVDAYGSPTIQSDLHTFDQAYGLKDPTLNIIYPGGSPVFNSLSGNEVGWAEETSLDVEWAHAIAPDATIDLVVAASNAGNVLNNAEQYVVSNHLANVMSMSFGAPEGAIAGAGDNLQLQQADAIYQQAKSEGITVYASSGDSGASQGYSTANALFPASDPYVTAVGGTDLFINGQSSYGSEYTWNDSDPSTCPFGCDYGVFGATGGAPSAIYSAPSYQKALSGQSARTTSDVSYNASVYTAVMVYLGFLGSANNGFYFFGGTSEGAPQWAAITALINQAAANAGKAPVGFLNPQLYAIGANAKEYAADFHDVTVGNNDLYGPGFNATTGYDLPTGLGSPNVANLISTLVG